MFKTKLCRALLLGLAAVACDICAPFCACAALFVTSNGQVLIYDATTGTPVGNGVFVAAGTAGLTGPIDLVFGPNGNLFVADQSMSRVMQFDGITGAPVNGGIFVPANSAALGGPWGLAFGPNGNLFVSDSGNGRVLQFDGATGAPIGSGIFVTAGSAGLVHPQGLAFGPNGDLFVSDDAGAVLRYSGTTGAPVGAGIFVAGTGGFTQTDLAFAPNGNLIVSDRFNNEILQFDGNTGAPLSSGVFVPGGSAGLNGPLSLAFGSNGDVFVGNLINGSTGSVLRFDGTNGAPVGSGIFVPSGSAGLAGPNSLAFSPAGTVPEPSTGLMWIAGSMFALCAYRSRQFRLRWTTFIGQQ